MMKLSIGLLIRFSAFLLVGVLTVCRGHSTQIDHGREAEKWKEDGGISLSSESDSKSTSLTETTSYSQSGEARDSDSSESKEYGGHERSDKGYHKSHAAAPGMKKDGGDSWKHDPWAINPGNNGSSPESVGSIERNKERRYFARLRETIKKILKKRLHTTTQVYSERLNEMKNKTVNQNPSERPREIVHGTTELSTRGHTETVGDAVIPSSTSFS